MAEMSLQASAYNGEALTAAKCRSEGNTVGSLTEMQRSIIIGSLLGDGAMRCKVNAYYRCFNINFRLDPVTTDSERMR